MFNFLVSAQDGRYYTGKDFAKKELDKALILEKEHHYTYGRDPLIKDKEMAIKVVEPILFSTYGQKNIELQQPYEIYKFNRYYVISGTLPTGYIGGTFTIIIDETNSRILNMIHYK